MAKKRNEQLAEFLDSVAAFELPLTRAKLTWFQVNGKLILVVEWQDGEFYILRPACDLMSAKETFQAVREYVGLTEE